MSSTTLSQAGYGMTQSGFTLIELMVTIAIVAVLAAIAIPSYRQYIVRNAENQAQSKMKQLQIELESWRANSLTYKGFVPKKISSDGKVDYSYDTIPATVTPNLNGTDVIIYNNDGTARYTIKVVNIPNTGTASTLNPATSTPGDINYNAWSMTAEPATYLKNYGASNIILTSKGMACKSTQSMNITASTTACPQGATSW